MLHIENIQFGFGGKAILSNINAHFEEGKIYGVLGLNGAGKTTLFRLIFGMYRPYEGNIMLNGTLMSKSDIAFLETENYFYPYTKGIEYLQLVTTLQVKMEEVQQWNTLFELPLDDLIDTYSTGMLKKLAFLGILLQNRKVIILDEPFNGIDLESSERLFIIIDALRKKGKIILLSSHILSSLTNICDEILHISESKISAIYQRINFDQLTATLQSKIKDDVQKHLNSMMF